MYRAGFLENCLAQKVRHPQEIFDKGPDMIHFAQGILEKKEDAVSCVEMIP